MDAKTGRAYRLGPSIALRREPFGAIAYSYGTRRLQTSRSRLARAVPYAIGPRRPGDAGRIVTSAARAEAELGWTEPSDLHEMVASAWDAWNRANLAGTARLG